jgi:hypothetical protein
VDEDCVYIHGSPYKPQEKREEWGDHRCSERLPSICELQAQVEYKFFEKPASWSNAQANCEDLGGNLAHIGSYGEDGRAWAECASSRCWIGLNDRVKEGSFVWTDGSVLGDLGFSHWAVGEPNNAGVADSSKEGEDCVYLHGATYQPFSKRQYWGDHPCGEEMAYICELHIASSKQLSIVDMLKSGKRHWNSPPPPPPPNAHC